MKGKFQRLCALLLACAMMLGMVPAVMAGDEPAAPDHVIVNQVYGGGSDGSASHSFIELYNPTAADVDLSAWSIQYRSSESGSQKDAWVKLDLTGTIKSKGYYLIRCGATTGAAFSVPAGNQEWDIQIHNKGVSVALVSNQELLQESVMGDVTKLEGSGIVDLAAVQGNDAETDQVPCAYETDYAAMQSKKKAIRRVDFADTDNNAVDFEVVDYSKSVSADKQPHVGETVTAPETPEEPEVSDDPAYTPVVAGDTRVTGYYDGTGSLKLELAGRYNSGAMNEDGGSLEIVQYNAINGYAYAVSGVKGKLIAVDLNGSLEGDTVVTLSGTEYNLKTVVSAEGFTYGDMTSVAISPDGSKLAVAIQAEDHAANGLVALFACGADGALTLLSTAAVGVQPDMVTFANESTLLTADEGEPRAGTSGTDPKGSVSVITIGGDNAMTAVTVTFDSFDAKRDELTEAGVLVQKNTDPSTDFEPEYIAVSGNTAYISLQEANAIAVLDIAGKTFTGVYPLGFQDYSQTQVDLQKDGKVELKNYDNVYGIKMPDGISVTTIGGRTYLLTANEGDSRADWEGLDNEYESKASPTGSVTLDKKVVWFNSSMWDGLDADKAYVFGGRSFSIYEVTATGLNLVYDSGSGFEEVTAAQLPDYFNASNNKTELDNRSGKKGPEPETVTVGTVDGKTYAFIALERTGGVMVYDITEPANTTFVNYINSREFDAAIQGDVSPEGLCFVPATDSKAGKALLLTACEVSGTLAVYGLTPAPAAPPEPEPSPDPVKDCEKDGACPAASFADVVLGDWYHDGIHYCVEQGLMNGTGSTTFSPHASSTRAMLVTVLYRMEGEPETGACAFTDVEAGLWYSDAIAWAAEHGIVEGYGNGKFGPGDIITREQMAAILYRYARYKGYDVTGRADITTFTDGADTAKWAEEAMAWAVAEALFEGVGGNKLDPRGSAVRAQLATILYRFCENAA